MEGSDHIYNSTDGSLRQSLGAPFSPSRAGYFALHGRQCSREPSASSMASVIFPRYEFYFYLLAPFTRECMRGADLYSTTLVTPAPRSPMPNPKIIDHHPLVAFRPDDVEIPGELCNRRHPGLPSSSITKKWAHPLELKSFRIARAPLTNGDFFLRRGWRLPQAAILSADGWRWLELGGTLD